MRWVGHLVCMDDSGILKRLLYGESFSEKDNNTSKKKRLKTSWRTAQVTWKSTVMGGKPWLQIVHTGNLWSQTALPLSRLTGMLVQWLKESTERGNLSQLSTPGPRAVMYVVDSFYWMQVLLITWRHMRIGHLQLSQSSASYQSDMKSFFTPVPYVEKSAD